MQRPFLKRVQVKHLRNQNQLHHTLFCSQAESNINDELTLLCQASQILNSTKPNGYTLVHLIRTFASLGSDNSGWGWQLHGYIVKSGFISNVFVSTSLLQLYAKIRSLSSAQKLFDEISQPTVVTWNSLICGYLHSGKFHKALILFNQLDRSDNFHNAFLLTAALVACGKLSLIQLGRSIHTKSKKLGLNSSIVVSNCLINMYGKCGSIEDAIQVFDRMKDKDDISWNSVIAACARNNNLDQALSFLQQMPNPDTISYNELINGFAQFGDVEEAIKILSNLKNPSSSSWNSIITGYVNRGRIWEALDFFAKMHSSNIGMDEFTFSSILSGVGVLSSAFNWGMLIHCCTVKHNFDTSVVVGTALIDMYSKCGQVNISELIFNFLPEKNLISWNAMLSGYAHNGESAKVIELFEQLKKSTSEVKPDEITFLNVLAACLHDQIPVETMIRYVESMIKDYGVNPTLEHCCTVIRIMGEKGEVSGVERMIYDFGFGSCGIVWRALLSACVARRDLRMGMIAAAKAIRLDSEDEFVYVMMSNLYASYGKWRHVKVVREVMRRKGMRKDVGCSWIEVDNCIPNATE